VDRAVATPRATENLVLAIVSLAGLGAFTFPFLISGAAETVGLPATRVADVSLLLLAAGLPITGLLERFRSHTTWNFSPWV
jgi:hypothetical protein